MYLLQFIIDEKETHRDMKYANMKKERPPHFFGFTWCLFFSLQNYNSSHIFVTNPTNKFPIPL